MKTKTLVLVMLGMASATGQATGSDVHDKWGEWYLVAPDGTQVEK